MLCVLSLSLSELKSVPAPPGGKAHLSKPEDQLRPHSSSGLEGSTETRSRYGAKQGRRAAAKKGGNLATNKDGDFDDGTVNRYSYDYREGSSVGQGRPQKVRGREEGGRRLI